MTPEQFDRWKQDEVTQEVLRYKRERLRNLVLRLGHGACLGDSGEHGKAVGQVLEIEDFLVLTFDDLQPTESYLKDKLEIDRILN